MLPPPSRTTAVGLTTSTGADPHVRSTQSTVNSTPINSRTQSPLPPSQRTRQQQPLQTQTTSSTTTTLTSTSTPIILHLRGQHDPPYSTTNSQPQDHRPPRERHIAWSSNVIDNEHLNRKKSKVCCIYHKTRAVGESSSEDDDDASSSDSDSNASDSDMPDGARPISKGKRKGGHGHEDGDGCAHRHGNHEKRKGKRKETSPNAYEKLPRARKKD